MLPAPPLPRTTRRHLKGGRVACCRVTLPEPSTNKVGFTVHTSHFSPFKMWSLLVLVAVVVMTTETLASGAGRAFPISSENYAIEAFQRINRNIEWDPTNFLVDLSGIYANCARVGFAGTETVDQKTQDGGSIGAVIDFTSGSGADVNAVNMYISEILDQWVMTGRYNGQIQAADHFGCSVRPGCNGQVVVACLFSPSHGGRDPEDQTVRFRPNTPAPRPKEPSKEPQEQVGPTQTMHRKQTALAFTKEQYDVAERILGNKWDRSHFLENLSGFETQCAMADRTSWAFAFALAEGSKRGMNVLGLFGKARNRGSTQEAMEQILRGFKEIRLATNVGCSIIPDCMGGRGDTGQSDMYVVVSCIYEEL